MTTPAGVIRPSSQATEAVTMSPVSASGRAKPPPSSMTSCAWSSASSAFSRSNSPHTAPITSLVLAAVRIANSRAFAATPFAFLAGLARADLSGSRGVRTLMAQRDARAATERSSSRR